MTPCCACSLILNEQTGAHFCGGCGETVASTVTQANGSNMTDALQASEDLAARGATAPRVSLESMKNKVLGEHYFTAGAAAAALGQPGHPTLDMLTICILVMQNGFTIIGKSAPASPENFDPVKGQTFAYEDAIKQLWPLEGYALRDKLAA